MSDEDRVVLGHRRAPWRVGRKLGRTLYERVFADRASDDDRFLGIFDNPQDAELVVALHNAHPDVLTDLADVPAAATAKWEGPSLAAEFSLLLHRRPDLTAADRKHLVEVVAAFERWRRAARELAR